MAGGKDSHAEAWQCSAPNHLFGKRGHPDGVRWSKTEARRKKMESHDTHGWIISAFLREMAGLEGQAMFERAESSFSFNRCLRLGSAGAPRLWQKMATQLLAHVDENWTKEKNGHPFGLGREGLVRDPEPTGEKKPHLEIDLRVEGVSQDAILQDEEKMKEIDEQLEKFEMGSRTKSIRNDLSKGNMICSEESSRAIYEMGNMDFIELRRTSATIQCLSCLKHVPEGLNMCQCGIWLRPNQSTVDRIRTAVATLKTPCCRASIIIS